MAVPFSWFGFSAPQGRIPPSRHRSAGEGVEAHGGETLSLQDCASPSARYNDPMSALLHPDGLRRCPWPKQDPLYVAYHDDEWGVPERDDRALFEKLVLDGFQAGLSWITILRKRDNFRRAFDDFKPAAIARYDQRKVAALMSDAGIVRNRAKIEGAMLSARAFLDVMEKGPGFSALLWDFVDGAPQVNHRRRIADVPAETPVSRAISKELAGRGFKFVGPTIVYAFMQAVGMVNDHLVTCYCHPDGKK
jgi:DNA-3-methyladenine glycosylase I